MDLGRKSIAQFPSGDWFVSERPVKIEDLRHAISKEVRLAIEYIIPSGEPVELLPRCSEIMARQLELVESYQLAAEKSGTEMNPRLQILPQRLRKKTSYLKNSGASTRKHRDQILGSNSVTGGGGGTSVSRLPFLPDWLKSYRLV